MTKDKLISELVHMAANGSDDPRVDWDTAIYLLIEYINDKQVEILMVILDESRNT